MACENDSEQTDHRDHSANEQGNPKQNNHLAATPSGTRKSEMDVCPSSCNTATHNENRRKRPIPPLQTILLEVGLQFSSSFHHTVSLPSEGRLAVKPSMNRMWGWSSAEKEYLSLLYFKRTEIGWREHVFLWCIWAKIALFAEVVQFDTVEDWKDCISLCLSNRAEIGQTEDILRRDRCQPTEALTSLLNQYKRICGGCKRSTGAPTLVLYGICGSGKSQTLLSVLRENSLWNPDRALYINCGGTGLERGNEFLEVLSETLKYPGETHPRNLALALVDAAKNPSTSARAKVRG